jgi:DNA-binding NarL/FixJ family response regulator
MARELYGAFARDLSELSFRIDETIGLNSTNPLTRQSLRNIRSTVSAIIAKSEHMRSTQAELTNREKDVLLALASGLSTQQICEKLFLSQPTVKTHLASCYRKLSVTNRVGAIVRAKELGILPEK